MSVLTDADLTTKIDSEYANNTTEAITPLTHRTVHGDMKDSKINKKAGVYFRGPVLATGSANTYSISISDLYPSSYTQSIPILIQINLTNTGASTLNINGLGVLDWKNSNDTALSSGQLEVDKYYFVQYNGTFIELMDVTTIAAVIASSVSVDDSGFDVIEGSNVQTSFDSIDNALLNARTTGARFGGIASVNGGLGTGDTIDLTAGAGQILNNTDAENPTYTAVSWTAKTDVALTSTNPNITYWYFDDNTDTLKQQTTVPTRAERRTKLFLFRTSYTSSLTAITGVDSEANPVQQEGSSIKDFAELIGSLRTVGEVIPSAASTNLTLIVTTGGIFNYGSNYDVSYIDPHVTTIPAFNSNRGDTFRYAIPSGVIATDQTTFQVANYAPSGVVAAIPGANSRVGIHYIFIFSPSNVRIVYGSEYYSNSDEAISALGAINPLDLAPSGFRNAFLLGAFIAQKDETDASNGTFVVTNQFGSFGGGVAGQSGALLSANNLSDLVSASDSRTNLGLGSSSVAALIDDDSFDTATSTNIPSAESVKSYVDNNTGSTFTPTVSGQANVSSSSSSSSRYVKVGNTIIVSFKVNITPTATSTETIVNFDLPVASSISLSTDISGVLSGRDLNGDYFSGYIEAEAANNRADLYFKSLSTDIHFIRGTFQYIIA